MSAKKNKTPEPVEHVPLTRAGEALARWHATPGNRETLASLLQDPTLSLALSTLQVLAQVQPNSSTDLTALALAFKRAEGYQSLLNDLRALAQPPPSKPKGPPEQFSHLAKITETLTA